MLKVQAIKQKTKQNIMILFYLVRRSDNWVTHTALLIVALPNSFSSLICFSNS